MITGSERDARDRRVCRMWRGWTSRENAPAYTDYLEHELFPKMAAELAGFRGHQLLIREVDCEVEFVVLTWYDSLDAVRAFAGDDIGMANVSDKARALLARFDHRATHYQLAGERLADESP